MDDHLSLVFAALADPIRRAMLDRLARGPATVGELAEPHEVSLPAISRHLGVLERAGLIVKERDAQWRRCRLDAEGVRRADAYLAPFRAYFDERFDRLTAMVEADARSRHPLGKETR